MINPSIGLMDPYSAVQWYWMVTGSSQIWSGISLSYIEPNDVDFVAWTQRNVPTMIDSTTSLLQVMVEQVKPIVMTTGVTLLSDPGGHYSLSNDALTQMSNLSSSVLAGRIPGGGDTFNFIDADGVQRAFTGPQFSDFVHACNDYVYNWTQALISNLNGSAVDYPPTFIGI